MLGLQGFFVCWAVSNSVHMYQIHTRIELFVANKKKYPAVSPKKKVSSLIRIQGLRENISYMIDVQIIGLSQKFKITWQLIVQSSTI